MIKNVIEISSMLGQQTETSLLQELRQIQAELDSTAQAGFVLTNNPFVFPGDTGLFVFRLERDIDSFSHEELRSLSIAQPGSKLLDFPVEKLAVSNRTMNALLNRGIKTTGQLVAEDLRSIGRMKGIGKVTVSEIVKAVHELGLQFKLE